MGCVVRSGNRYDATVCLDGSWTVTHVTDAGYHSYEIEGGKAKDQRHGELAARCAIEDHKADLAKSHVKASMVREFSVKA